MKQKPSQHRLGDFLEGKGFYIILLLCVAAIGISGYYLYSGLTAQPEGFGDSAVVSGQAELPKPADPGAGQQIGPDRSQNGPGQNAGGSVAPAGKRHPRSRRHHRLRLARRGRGRPRF